MLEDGDAVELKARVDREEALAFLGHRGQKLGDLRERLERAACLCEKELVPRGVYREMDASEALALPALLSWRSFCTVPFRIPQYCCSRPRRRAVFRWLSCARAWRSMVRW